MSPLRQIQTILGVEPDGKWGKLSQQALDKAIALESGKPTSNTGTTRTDWRGYVDVSESALAGALPLAAKPLARSFLRWAKEHDLHPLFLVAISQHETGSWTSNVFRNKNNAMGISDRKGAIAMPSHDESIRRMAAGLSRPTGYYAKCKTLADIAKVYAPVGAANDPGELNGYWPVTVAKYWAALEKAVGL